MESKNSLRGAGLILAAALLLGGCSSGSDAPAAPSVAPQVTLGYGIKTLNFNWAPVDGATHYKVLENPDGASGYSQVGGDLTATEFSHGIALHKRINARYQVEACNSGGCTGSAEIFMANRLVDAIGYVKASNTDAQDTFGNSVALSGDGNTLAVGAYQEDSAATGIGGDEASNAASSSGAVYVFTRAGGAWTQQAYVKASNTGGGDYFGKSVALSDDGNTLAVGAFFEGSAATGIDGVQADNTASSSGAVYVFTRTNGAWSQQAYVKASNTGASDYFGQSLTLSDDGNTLAVGAQGEDSAATGIDGGQADNTATDSGAVYIFTRTSGTWSQQAYVKASNTGAGDYFGNSVALSGDGNTLAVGATGEASLATGIDGDETDNTATGNGAVYLFTRTGGIWSQQAYVKASNPGFYHYFGQSLALADDGNTLAVGAHGEESAATGIDGDATDNTASYSGAVYVFTRASGAWSQQAYVKASNTEGDDSFGYSVALAGDGNTLAVGAYWEASAATGIDGGQADNSATESGAVYVFTRASGTWSQQAYVKAANTGVTDLFGSSVALSGDGNTLAVGATQEESAATGIDGDPADNNAWFSGAVYLY